MTKRCGTCVFWDQTQEGVLDEVKPVSPCTFFRNMTLPFWASVHKAEGIDYENWTSSNDGKSCNAWAEWDHSVKEKNNA
jgi:hypothetical protein